MAGYFVTDAARLTNDDFPDGARLQQQIARGPRTAPKPCYTDAQRGTIPSPLPPQFIAARRARKYANDSAAIRIADGTMRR